MILRAEFGMVLILSMDKGETLEKHRCSVGDQGVDHGAVGDELGLLGVTVVCLGQVFHESDPLSGSRDNICIVRAEK